MATNVEKQDVFVKRMMTNRPDWWRSYSELIAHEKLSKDEFHRLNWEKRIEILRFAYERTSFYKDLYGRVGIHPDDVKTEDDWSRLPIVTKQMLKDHFEEIKVDGGRSSFFKNNARLSASGGSTGKPVRFYIDVAENGSMAPFNSMRAMGWWMGRRKGEIFADKPILGQDEAWVVRMNVYRLLKSSAVREEIARHIAPSKRYYIDILDMGMESIKLFLKDIEVGGGVFHVMGYTGALEEIAKQYLSGNIERHFAPSVVSALATRLTETSRKIIEKGWGCPAFEVYGSNEVSYSAFSCEIEGRPLRISADLRHFDIVDGNGVNVQTGTEGVVAVTDFMNHVFPFVRYSLGDRTRILDISCPLGMPFPFIAPINGRESDYLYCKDGSRVYGLCCAFDEHPNCALRYQFVQHKIGKVTLRVVPNKAYSSWEKEIGIVFNELRRSAGDRIDYDLQYESEIPHDNGKLRFIVYE